MSAASMRHCDLKHEKSVKNNFSFVNNTIFFTSQAGAPKKRHYLDHAYTINLDSSLLAKNIKYPNRIQQTMTQRTTRSEANNSTADVSPETRNTPYRSTRIKSPITGLFLRRLPLGRRTPTKKNSFHYHTQRD